MGKTLSIAPQSRAKKAGKKSSTWREYGFALLVAVGLALLAKTFFIQAFRTPSRSMEDSLLLGDFLLVDKLSYGAFLPFSTMRLPALVAPKPGDVVVFKYPPDPERVYIKRCIAVPGQVVEIRNKVVYVDGIRALDPPYSKYVEARIFSSSQNPRDNYGPLHLPEGFIFVMGDNRDNSRDSRHWGMLSQDLVIGKAMCIYWSCEPEARPAKPGLLVNQIFSLPQRIRWKRLGDWVR